MAVIIASLVVSVTAVAVEATAMRQKRGGRNKLVQESKQSTHGSGKNDYP
jgi:hypothetical protein